MEFFGLALVLGAGILALEKLMKAHGEETVHSEGELERAFYFRPAKAMVEFTDPDPVEPLPSCAPCHPDWVKVDICRVAGGRWGIKVRWHVHGSQPRKIRWDVRGLL